MADDGVAVWLYIYDLSGGMAKAFSPMILGKPIDGIWHTAIVMNGTEYFYGGSGIQSGPAGRTPFGNPVEKKQIGTTHLPNEIVEEFLVDISSRFRPEAYNLLKNNCNNFSDEFARFLTGDGIPAHITGLPDDVMSTPFGQMIAPMVQQLEREMANMTASGFQSYAPPPASAPQASVSAAVSSTQAATSAGTRAESCMSTQGGGGTGAAADTSAATGAAAAAGPSSSNTEAAARERLEALIKQEFSALMAVGNITANEAAVLAIKQARGRLLRTAADRA